MLAFVHDTSSTDKARHMKVAKVSNHGKPWLANCFLVLKVKGQGLGSKVSISILITESSNLINYFLTDVWPIKRSRPITQNTSNSQSNINVKLSNNSRLVIDADMILGKFIGFLRIKTFY